MEIVYRKTERGVTEIATRQHKLAPRLRSALVVVDGKRTDQELAALIAGQPQETLQALLEAGFIEPAHGAPERLTHPATPGMTVQELPPTPEALEAVAEEAVGYAPTQPLEDIGEPEVPAAAARLRPPVPPPARPVSTIVPARTLDTTKRHVVQWLTQHLGSQAEATNRRIERCDTSEALSSAILAARALVEQQLGAETARRFETEMFTALRRGMTA
jgi:hypothetical protein